MVTVGRVQDALRDGARRRYEAVSVPPFTAFFHPSDPLPYFNYAIPDRPVSAGLDRPLRALRAAFEARGRRARFEFLEAYAPDLGPALVAAGFQEEARQALLVRDLAERSPVPFPDGLTVVPLTAGADPEEARTLIATQRLGFDPTDRRPVEDGDVRGLLKELERGAVGYLARLEGRPVGAALTTEPADGMPELCGLVTQEPFRGRGVATSLVAAALRRASESGLESVFLTAADEAASRVYARAGFLPLGVALSYGDPPPRGEATRPSREAPAA
jgi:GNAT superfamily N-acetyltransferase